MRIKCDITVLLLGISLMGLTTGCSKKVAMAPPPPPPIQEAPPPTPAGPTASITVEPPVIEAGQAVTLKWATTNATTVTIAGLGAVAAEGKQEVRPAKSTTYELVANGPGGSAGAKASVSVMAPPPPIAPPPPPVTTKSLQDRVETEVADIYFDYDQTGIRADARAALAKDAEALLAILADFPAAIITLEGHCDERGSAEYNLGLGDRRAASAREFIEALGVPAERLKTVSFGKERPRCTEASEECWQTNRRAHFSAGGPPTGTN